MAVLALVRPPAPSFVHALSHHSEKKSIDFDRAVDQHRGYMEALEKTGITVTCLPPLDEFPDSTFIEDNAVIMADRALLTFMKEASRHGETLHIRKPLEKFLPVETLQAPVLIDGGDILQTESTVFVGQSQRTNRQAAEALSQFTRKKIVTVPVHRGPHLKTFASYLGKNVLVIDPTSVEPDAFATFERIEVCEEERYAANCLAVGNHVLMPEGFPDLADRIAQHGFEVVPLAMSEFEKADGGVTCLSLIFS